VQEKKLLVCAELAGKFCLVHRGKVGNLKHAFFFTSIPATNTPDAHTAQGFTKELVSVCAQPGLRSLVLLNWSSWKLLSESKLLLVQASHRCRWGHLGLPEA